MTSQDSQGTAAKWLQASSHRSGSSASWTRKQSMKLPYNFMTSWATKIAIEIHIISWAKKVPLITAIDFEGHLPRLQHATTFPSCAPQRCRRCLDCRKLSSVPSWQQLMFPAACLHLLSHGIPFIPYSTSWRKIDCKERLAVVPDRNVVVVVFRVEILRLVHKEGGSKAQHKTKGQRTKSAELYMFCYRERTSLEQCMCFFLASSEARILFAVNHPSM